MPQIAFIGDEVTAAGFRLAGVAVHTPPPAETARVFRELSERCDLVMITAERFERLPEADREATSRAGRPLVAVIPDIRRRAPVPDVENAVRRALGIEL